MSKLLSDYLVKKKMTQRSLADELKITTAFVNGIVNGKNTDVKISLLKKIHEHTKIPMNKLVDDLLACKKSDKL